MLTKKPAGMAKIQANQPIGYRIATIGPGGVEYNVQTDATWDAAQNLELRHTCRACGAAYWDFDLPRGGDNTVSDGTAIAYCDACGEIDNFKIDEVQYANG